MNKKIKKNKYEQDQYQDIFDDKEKEEYQPIIKKKSKGPQPQQENQCETNKAQEQANFIRCPIEPINIEQILQDILYESSKESQYSKALKNILMIGQKELKDKHKYYQFKWQNLGHSNISRQEYQRQEQHLKEQETKDIAEIQNNVIGQLSNKGVKGFQSREEILNEFRNNFMKKRHLTTDGPVMEEFQFFVDQEEANRLRRDQISLLEKLMEESHLIPENVPIKREVPQTRTFIEPIQQPDMQQRLQLLPKLPLEKIIKEKLNNITQKKIEDMLQLSPTECQVIPRNVRVMLLDSKSDELYTDKDFQSDQAERYIEIFNHLKQHNFHELDLNQLLELTIYIVNNTHYQQKFKLQEDRKQVTPKELLAYIERLQRQ